MVEQVLGLGDDRRGEAATPEQLARVLAGLAVATLGAGKLGDALYEGAHGAHNRRAFGLREVEEDAGVNLGVVAKESGVGHGACPTSQGRMPGARAAAIHCQDHIAHWHDSDRIVSR